MIYAISGIFTYDFDYVYAVSDVIASKKFYYFGHWYEHLMLLQSEVKLLAMHTNISKGGQNSWDQHIFPMLIAKKEV